MKVIKSEITYYEHGNEASIFNWMCAPSLIN